MPDECGEKRLVKSQFVLGLKRFTASPLLGETSMVEAGSRMSWDYCIVVV
jgi:hypothetical protein